MLFFYNYSYFYSILFNEEDLPYPIIHYYKTNSEFYTIDRLYFERDYSLNLKIDIIQPKNGTILIDSYAFGERERENANFLWIKSKYQKGFYHIDGILPKREVYLRLKIKTNEKEGSSVGYLFFRHFFKIYNLKIILGTVKNFIFNENYSDDLIPYITGYNFEYGIVTKELEKNGGIHPYHPKIKEFSLKLIKNNAFDTAKNVLNFIVNFFSKGIDVTYIGDYPDYYYLDRYEKEKSISGVCSERSIVFASITRSLGIPTRFVYASGYPVDHVFVECFINNRWINFDPTYNFFDKYNLYYEKNVRNLTTLLNFFSGAREHFKKYKDNIYPTYPYQDVLNQKYMKESIVIIGLSGVKIGDSYYLKAKIRWTLFNKKEKKLNLIIFDSFKNKKVIEIFAENLFYNFAEGTISLKMDIKNFLEINGKRQFRIVCKLLKNDIVVDSFDLGEGLLLENFSF